MTLRISVFRATLPIALLAAGFVFSARPGCAQAVSTLSKNAQAAAPESPYHGDVVEDIIARVNDQVISSSDYNRAESDLEQQAKQHNWPPSELDSQKRQLLSDLIDNQLLLSKGKQLGITGEAETIRQLDEIRKQNHLDSMEALEKAAQDQGVSFADFKASIQNRAITSQVIRDEVGRRINITNTDEQQYYNDHKDQFTTPEEVKLSEILVPTADPDNAGQVADAQKKADALQAQLKGGKNFAAVAKAASGGSTAAEGGALGSFKSGQLAPVLEQATFSLKPGEYTAPIRTKQGFVILKVDQHEAAGLQPFSQVEPQVEEAIGMQKMQPALRAYLTRLREEAFIDVKPGYVDTAASKNETRPVFSAYTPPQPKKKKAVARTRFSGRGRGGERTRGSAIVAAKTAPAPTAGVPSLADVSAGKQAQPVAGKKTVQTASVLKPGKREKVRFGQAPRETLPAAATQTKDAGASAENGNGSNAETASAQATDVNRDIHYENGESAAGDQAQASEKKTRFSDRAKIPKAVKEERARKAKQDPFPAPAPDAQEVADKATQDQPLGLRGDTSKAPPKPKPTGKTRFSDEAGKKKDTTEPGAPGVPVNAPTYVGPSPQNAPVTRAPVPTQATPNGTGDPMGPPTPPAAPPGAGAPPQR